MSMSLQKKHSPSTWGHDFKSSDPKIVGQEGKPCQMSNGHMKIASSHVNSLATKVASHEFYKVVTLLNQIPSNFMHSINSYPARQGMR